MGEERLRARERSAPGPRLRGAKSRGDGTCHGSVVSTMRRMCGGFRVPTYLAKYFSITFP